MTQYLLRRLLQTIPVLLLASIVVFVAMRLIPGDPSKEVLGADALPDQIQQFHRERGLDQPIPVQYVVWLGRAVQGDLGQSFISGYNVSALIKLKFPATLELTVATMVLATLIAIPLGILPAAWRNPWVARLTAGYNALGYAIPTFWLGIMLSMFVGLRLKWLPASGHVPLTEAPLQNLRFLVLPALTMAIGISVILARFLATALQEELGQDYVRTARAKGLGERLVLVRHAMRNALISVVTVFGLVTGTLMGGAVVTEGIFDWPGMGQALLRAILSRDYPTVQGIVLVAVTVFVLINLLVDLVYALLDPRIRYR